MRLIVVGGYNRDKYLGLPSKDVDFAIEASSYDEMKSWLLDTYPGLDIRVEDAQFGRMLAGIPTKYLNYSHPQHNQVTYHRKSPEVIHCDFVMSRSEGDYVDGKRPQFVKPASILEDLERRDFTMNAIAVIDETGEVLDPFHGRDDMEAGLIRTVGEPFERFSENATRIVRAIDFAVRKGMYLETDIWESFERYADDYAKLLTSPIFTDSIRETLLKAFKFDSVLTLNKISGLPLEMQRAIFSVIWLKPTTET